MGELEQIKADAVRIEAQRQERFPRKYRETGWAIRITPGKKLSTPDPEEVKAFKQWKLRILADNSVHVMAKAILVNMGNTRAIYETLLKRSAGEAEKAALKRQVEDVVRREIAKLGEELGE